jgi:hypothetical protein
MVALSRKAKRSATTLSYSLQKAYTRIITLKPPTLILSAIVMATSIFLLGGGIYDIVEQPIIAFVSGGRIIPYYPEALNEQLVAESIATMILYFFGATGLLLTYQSTKHAYNPRTAYTMLMIGLLLFVIGWIFVEFYLFPAHTKAFQSSS